MRNVRCLFATVLLLALAACQTSPTDSPGAEEFGVTILSVNLRDIMNHPQDATGVRWQERYARIGRWVAGAPLRPDFVVLQEAPGFWDCFNDHGRLRDYEALDFLLEELRTATGEQYRIAYFNSDKEGMSMPDVFVGDDLSGGCRVRGGRALLYRPSRVRNALASVSNALKYDLQTTVGPHAINSMPCCFPAPNHLNVCSLIDGPPQVTQRCTTPSPKGASWTDRHIGRNSENVTSAVFDRFELVQQPGNYIHIYNVHLVPDGNWNPIEGVTSINRLVDATEARFDPRNDNRLYPPILVGDFNIDLPGIVHNNPPNPPDPGNSRAPYFPRFDVAFWSPVNAHPIPSGVTGALIGKRSLFPSKQNAYVNNALALPSLGCENNGGSTLTLWSDHCAIYLRIEPAP